MLKTNFSFLHDGSVTPSKVKIGHDGDHNAHTLSFTPDEIIKEKTEYYRVFIDNFSSEPIYITDGKVEFTIPCGVLNVGVQFIQIKCYGTKNGEVSLILCSDIITASTDYSLSDGIKIPEELRADANTIKKELADLVVAGNEINKTTAENAKSAAESAEVARVCCNLVSTQKAEVEENTERVLNATEQTLSAATTAENAKNASQKNAEQCQADAKLNAIYANCIKDLGVAIESILEYSEKEYVVCQDEPIEVVNSDYWGEAAPKKYRSYIKINTQLKPNTTYTIISNEYYEVGNGTTEALVAPTYIAFGEMENKVILNSNINAFGDVESFVKTTFTTPQELLVSEPVFLVFEHNAGGNFISGDMLVTITALGQFPSGVDVYKKAEVNEILGNIDTALDGILALQENLLGGESE